jgi:hypothetical protein
MSLARLIQDNYYDIIEEADDHLQHSHLRHFCNSQAEKNSLRIKVFLDLLIGSIRTRNLAALLDYTENTAIERFETGADLCEVQRAINGLEKAIWDKIVVNMKAEDHAEALGLINAILDEAKDTLACRYVFCARQIPKSIPQISFSA